MGTHSGYSNHTDNMKLLVISCLVVMGSCAKLPLEEREEPIAILRSESFKDGANFNYNFESENGIAVDAVGSSNAAGVSNMQGSYKYILDDGNTANFNWIADEGLPCGIQHASSGSSLPSSHSSSCPRAN